MDNITFPYRNFMNLNPPNFELHSVPCTALFCGHKPKNGKWYAIGDSWYNLQSKDSQGEVLESNLYEVKFKKSVLTDIRNPDKNKVLVIKTVKDLMKFTEEYGIVDNYFLKKWISKSKKSLVDSELKKYHFIYYDPEYENPYIFDINWTKVCQDYAGVEIPVVFDSKSYGNAFWYSSWEIASGVIWNIEPIKEINLIHQIDYDYEEKYTMNLSVKGYSVHQKSKYLFKPVLAFKIDKFLYVVEKIDPAEEFLSINHVYTSKELPKVSKELSPLECKYMLENSLENFIENWERYGFEKMSEVEEEFTELLFKSYNLKEDINFTYE